MYQTTEYSFHMIPLKAQTDMDVTMTPANRTFDGMRR